MGTLFGIAATIFIIKHLEVNGWTIGLLLTMGIVLPVVLRLHKTVIHQIALTILLIIVFVHKTNYYVSDRIRDTIIGALVAIVVHIIIVPPNYVKEARRTLTQFGVDIGQLFEKVAYWVNNNSTFVEGENLIDDTTNLLQELHQVEKELRKAEKSLRLNPFGRNKKQQLKQNEQFLFQLKHGYTYISGVLTTFNDWSKTNSLPTVDRQKWAVQLQVLGEYVAEQANKNVENYSIKKSSFDLLDLSSIPLQISIPPELESHRYQLSLYNDTLKLIDKLGTK